MDSTKPVSSKSVFSQVISYFISSSSYTEPAEMNCKITEKDKDSESSESAYLNDKAHTLHSAHKMNEPQKMWFKNIKENAPFQFSPLHQENLPTYIKQKQFNPPEPDLPTSQLFFNINSNCYENLPVHQTSNNPYSTYCEEDFYPPELQYFHEGDETLALASSFLPLGNLYENIMDFVETTIVQYVCQRTHPSPFRLAAETLARSKLNPNAKEFSPQVKDSAVIESERDMEDKFYSKTQENSPEKDKQVHIEEVRTVKEENIIKVANPRQQSSVVKGETVEEFPNCLKLLQFNASDNSICDLRIKCDGYDSDDDCYDDDSDDSDWDSDEQSTGQCVEIDPSEFEDLFPSPLLVTNITVCKTKSSNPELKICQVLQSSSTADNSLPNTSSRTISQINSKLFDQNQTNPSYCKKSPTLVKFCDDVDIIEEPDDLAVDLQNARQSDFPARQADRERMERLLAPILTEVHRVKMFQKIYGDS